MANIHNTCIHLQLSSDCQNVICYNANLIRDTQWIQASFQLIEQVSQILALSNQRHPGLFSSSAFATSRMTHFLTLPYAAPSTFVFAHVHRAYDLNLWSEANQTDVAGLPQVMMHESRFCVPSRIVIRTCLLLKAQMVKRGITMLSWNSWKLRSSFRFSILFDSSPLFHLYVTQQGWPRGDVTLGCDIILGSNEVIESST